MTKYVQCKLEKYKNYGEGIRGGAFITQTSYIPTKYAKINNIIRLLVDGVWEEGWRVVNVFKDSETDEPPDWRKSIRNHRNATGDSLPKNES